MRVHKGYKILVRGRIAVQLSALWHVKFWAAARSGITSRGGGLTGSST
jgi:hypothetical protein